MSDYQCPECSETFDGHHARNGHITSHSIDTISEDEICSAIQSVTEEIGRPPSKSEFRDKSGYSTKTVRSLFGSWNEALESCGFERREPGGPEGDLNWNWTGSAGESTCDWCGDEYRRPPSEVREPGFCSTSCKYEWLSDTVDGHRSNIPYGPDWRSIRGDVIERDNYTCQICLDEPDVLCVHHIKQRSTFWESGNEKYDNVDWDQCNSKSNLVTLCMECHGRFEGKWQDASVDEFIGRAREQHAN